MKKRIICGAAALALAAGICAGLGEFQEVRLQKNLAGAVFRFHVLANSDSQEDQDNKMLVKERVISYLKEALPDSKSAQMTKEWAAEHLQEIEEVAAETLLEAGCEDGVRAEVVTSYFPEKSYGDVTFPRGYYDALRIEIGEAKGENWWCVLYPNLCFIDAVRAVVPDEGKEELKEVLGEEEYQMVTATSKFKIRWYFFR